MMGFSDGSGISWTICKQSAPCSRQITTSTPHHSIFTGWMLFLTPNQQCQSTEGIATYYHYYLSPLYRTTCISGISSKELENFVKSEVLVSKCPCYLPTYVHIHFILMAICYTNWGLLVVCQFSAAICSGRELNR